ncbi:Fungalysin metallopeptidase-domain-containing protein [Mycena floridula]|nr:Fungalysin metallopeptidase-domain-containing protein [Mycena floridula]
MRCILTTALLAVVASSALAHFDGDDLPRRKTLGFGPHHPHAVYRSSALEPVDASFVAANPDADPFDVARQFVEDLLADQLDDANSYKIRKDSYTDKNSGITHVYVRQVVNHLEVTDGDMNINVRDGKVISYGDSFFRGVAPRPFSNPESNAAQHSNAEMCSRLEEQFNNFFLRLSQPPTEQLTLTSSQPSPELILELIEAHCGDQDPLSLDTDVDALSAILEFMIAATPDDEVVSDILANYDAIMEEMSQSTMTVPPFAPTDDPIVMLVDKVPDTVNPVKAKLGYVQVPDSNGNVKLHLVWKMEVEMQDNWYEAAVSATTPHRIISVVDWASDSPIPKPQPDDKAATYNVFAWGINDPSVGNRSIEKENFDPLASPMGWHSIPFANDPSYDGVRRKNKEFWRNTTTTWGNNVFAQENWEGQNSFIDNYRPDAADKAFDHKYSPKVTDKTDAQAEAQSYINATVTQLFYTSNMVHDLYYRYGFDEVSGNFQQHNFGRGGAENDAVIANAQDGSGYNNANFMTPPDGSNGRMRMYLWNTALPYRDGDFEAGIVIHELSHGLSTRLTGGPANSGCLGWGESGGMGEGWGDFLATTIRSTKTYSDYPMGEWAANRAGGIRIYPYSLNDTINPSTYKILDKPNYWGVHAIGEVWAQMLWVVSQRLIAIHGFSDSLFPPTPNEDGTIPEGDFYRPAVGKKPLVPKHGNSLIVQLVFNGMKLQPCRPSFFDARDAIILADQQLTGGENFCTLWKAFAETGLGADASIIGGGPWGGGIRTNVCLCLLFSHPLLLFSVLRHLRLRVFSSYSSSLLTFISQGYTVPIACQ